MAAQLGDRVGAIRDADDDKVYLYGYGVYDGVIEEGYGVGSPRIKLDQGGFVYGYQCWWGNEEAVKKFVGGRAVEIVPVEE